MSKIKKGKRKEKEIKTALNENIKIICTIAAHYSPSSLIYKHSIHEGAEEEEEMWEEKKRIFRRKIRKNEHERMKYINGK